MSIDERDGDRGPRTRTVAVAGVRGLALALISLPGAVVCFVLAAVSIALIPIGVGLVTTPYVLTGVRAFADRRRVLAAEWGGVRIPQGVPAAAAGRQPLGPTPSGCSATRRPGGICAGWWWT
ncbi:histidine kinase OS=Streptomyces fumanus OX=67302 GN=GCM10018772_00480 PE=4 SV=1 [Streptomyces fumanus]